MHSILPCLLLSLGEKKIILPTAAVAEIIPFEAPESIADTPSWFIGILTWRGIHIPCIDMQKIEPFLTWREVVPGKPVENQKKIYMAILNRVQKTTQNQGSDISHQYPFFAVLIQGIPKLYRLGEDGIKLMSRETSEDSQSLMMVRVQNSEAEIPNLPYFWGIIDDLPSRLQWFRPIVL